MKLKLCVTLVVLLLQSGLCDHLIAGEVAGKRLLHHGVAEYNTILFIKREKSYFYSDPNQSVITGLMVYDTLNSKATATVTAGGLGYTFVNIQMKSERGVGLHYDIGIYS